MLNVLLRAILEDPNDDLPRLAYADHLEETGGDIERAEFIRIQIERHRRASAGVRMSDEERTMREREWKLWESNHPKPSWFGEFVLWPLPPQFFVHRGFLDELELVGGWFGCDQMIELFDRHPLRKITVTSDWAAYSQRISSCVPLKLRVLHFSPACQMTRSEAIAVLSHSKHVGWEDTLEELSYEHGDLGAMGRLMAELPKVRIRHEGTLYSAENERGNRTILERPELATFTPSASEMVV